MPNGHQYQPKASVTITYDPGSGTIRVSDDPIYIMRRGRIDWQCDQGDWTVRVEGSDDLFDRGNTVQGRRGERKGDQVRADANHGQPNGKPYKYTVSVQADGGGTELDPEIVVGPDEPPGDEDNGG